ncbi:MAG: hypothetical protein ACREOW_00050 [Thermodesulfobacteriota bacterium]
MVSKRTHIVIPENLTAEIDSVVGKRGRSRFLVEAARRELKRLKTIQAIELATGAWKDKNHPELKRGSASWVEKLRKEEEKRFRRIKTQR